MGSYCVYIHTSPSGKKNGGHGGQTHSEETKRRISESCARVHSGKPRFQLLRKAVLEGSGLMSNDDNIPKG